MKEGKPSFSAEVIAAMRALESRRPEGLRICYDPYAKHLIRPTFKYLAQSKIVSKAGLAYIDKKGPGLRAGIAARTRYIDDIVKQEIANGIEQIVILGAGLDMRGVRLKELHDKRVFEVDFPATQLYKLNKLKRLKQVPNQHITYVQIDFNKDDLSQVLINAEYNSNEKTLFIWEGVTMYLNESAVDDTLNIVSQNQARGSSIYFDFLLKSVLDGTCDYPEAINVRETGSFNGGGVERYTFAIDGNKLESFLTQRGFTMIEEMRGKTLQKRYFHGKNSDRYVFRICGFVHAKITY